MTLICRLLAQDKTPADLLKMPVSPGRRIVIVHGGCWVAKLGNLDERAVALDLLHPLAAALTAAGFATWNVEYRQLAQLAP